MKLLSVLKNRSVLLLLLSAILFGLFNCVTAWFVFVPVLFLVERVPLKKIWLYGAFYGFFAYIFLMPWLLFFSVPAMLGASVFYVFYCALFFVALKLVSLYAGKFDFVFQLVVILLYEYIKTKGFTGSSYGVNGYTQWKNLYFIQIADIFGVWGVSFILDFCSVALFHVLCSLSKKLCFHKPLFLCAAECVLIIFAYIYGFHRVQNQAKIEESAKKITVAAIQHNTDPWKNYLSNYVNDVHALIALTDEALLKNPDIKIVVWPETAVVPSIVKAYNNYAQSSAASARRELVTELLEYIDSKNCTFVIGNVQMVQAGDFNASLVFTPKKNVIPPEPDWYAKIHLVPMSEYFPYKKQFPALYNKLSGGDPQWWTPGSERKVFTAEGLNFATPICFEDTFGSECRIFYKNGARAFLNLSNDAWAESLRCQVQHQQMAVFRSIENHIPTVRSTASGQTCSINTWGKITAEAEPFSKTFLIAEIPVLD